MTDAVLEFEGKLGLGLGEVGQKKVWVVAESLVAGGFVDDDAFYAAVGGGSDPALMRQGHDTAESGHSAFAWDAAKECHESGIIGVVVALLAGEAGRVNAGRAVECVHFETRVVGQGG